MTSFAGEGPISIEARAVLATGEPRPARVEVSGTHITEVTEPTGTADRVLGDDLLLAPGLIDLQVNGAGGRDFTRDPSAIGSTARTLARDGVTAFLPTIVTAPQSTALAAADALAADDPGRTEILGLHLEGPLISSDAVGAHDRTSVLDDAEELNARLALLSGVRMVTYAPELDPEGLLPPTLNEMGAVAALGHSRATSEQARRAADQGARHVTHLFNAMAPFHHRDPGLIGFALTEPGITASVIADGTHVGPEALQLAWSCLGPDRLALVSDAMAGLGYGDGTLALGPETVEVVDGVARTENGVLAGSARSLLEGVRHFAATTDATVADALRAASAVPADILGDRERGVIEVGRRADLVVVGTDLGVVDTYVGGRRAD